ncbi:MAG: hypothetical protein EBU33_07050 [Sphingobacteriia bacterium]|nr:hypothetical protein [Sphingobacteriia bacterium]
MLAVFWFTVDLDSVQPCPSLFSGWPVIRQLGTICLMGADYLERVGVMSKLVLGLILDGATILIVGTMYLRGVFGDVRSK